jgi:hypothetical protein
LKNAPSPCGKCQSRASSHWSTTSRTVNVELIELGDNTARLAVVIIAIVVESRKSIGQDAVHLVLELGSKLFIVELASLAIGLIQDVFAAEPECGGLAGSSKSL